MEKNPLGLPSEIADTPSEKGKVTPPEKTSPEDGILGDLELFKSKYSTKSTGCTQLSLEDAARLNGKSLLSHEENSSGDNIIDSILEDVKMIVISHDPERVADSVDVLESPIEEIIPKEEEIADEDETISEEINESQSEQADVKADSLSSKENEITESENVNENPSASKEADKSKEEDIIPEEEIVSSKDDDKSQEPILISDDSKDDSNPEDEILEVQITSPKDLADEPPHEAKEISKENLDEERIKEENDKLTDKDASEDAKSDENSLSSSCNNQEEKRGLVLLSCTKTDKSDDDDDEPKEKALDESKEEEVHSESTEIPEETAPKEKEKEKKKKEKKEKTPIEYNDFSQSSSILHELQVALSKNNISCIALLIAFVFSLTATSVPAVLDIFSIDTSSFANIANLSINIINLVLLAVSIVFSFKSFIKGFSIAHEGITADTVSSFTVIFALLHNIFIMFKNDAQGIASYSYISIAILSLLLSASAEKINLKKTISNFKFCAFDYRDNLYTIRPVEDRQRAEQIGSSMHIENPKILYSGQINFPQRFLENSLNNKNLNAIIKRNLVISLISCIAVCVISSFVFDDPFSVSSAFVGTFCLTAPIGTLFSLSIPLYSVNRYLNKNGASIVSYDAAKACAQADAVSIDSADLYDRGKCSLEFFDDMHTVRIDDVLLYSVAMIIQSGGPLSEVFNGIIEGDRSFLPPVRDLKYEDRQGLCARIRGHQVLIGTKKMMINHGVELPDNLNDEKFIKKGFKILYVSVDSVFAITYVLNYVEDKTLSNFLCELEDCGVRLIVRTDDPNVNEKSLAELFKLSPESIKMIEGKGSSAFSWFRNALKDFDDAGVLHDGNAFSYFAGITFCQRLNRFKSVYSKFLLCVQIALIAAVIASLIVGYIPLFSPLTAVAVHAAAVLIASVSQKFKV